MIYAWEPPESVAVVFQRALALSPNAADAHGWYGEFLETQQSRFDEALAEHDRAVTLDPLAPGRHLGFSLGALAARHYDVAKQEAARALTLEPSLMNGRKLLAISELLSGHAERCATASLGPYGGIRALCLYSRGQLHEAAHIVDSLTAALKAGTARDSTISRDLTAQALAEYYAWTGNPRESLAWLDSAFAVSPLGEEFTTINSGLYDKVRHDPHFKTGLEQLRERIRERVQQARREVSHLER